MKSESFHSSYHVLSVLAIFLLVVTIQAQIDNKITPECRSRVLSLVPKSLKYQNHENNQTKTLKCTSGELPNFALLDHRCYLMVYPVMTGDFQLSINLTIFETDSAGVTTPHMITLPYVLSISKIRYNEILSEDELEYDITLNRVINIATEQNSWLVKTGAEFYAQFTVNQTPKIYERVFFEFSDMVDGLRGDEITGVVSGTVKAEPGYYEFSVRAFDLEGNSERLKATVLVYDDETENSDFEERNFQDEETLRRRIAEIEQRENQLIYQIDATKRSIEGKLQSMASKREQLKEDRSQERKLQAAEKSLSIALQWVQGNLKNMANKLKAQQQALNQSVIAVNSARRQYQKSVFAIQEKQSEIETEQIEADRMFEEYLKSDRQFTAARIELEKCQFDAENVQKRATANLEELERANFVQNLKEIISDNGANHL